MPFIIEITQITYNNESICNESKQIFEKIIESVTTLFPQQHCEWRKSEQCEKREWRQREHVKNLEQTSRVRFSSDIELNATCFSSLRGKVPENITIRSYAWETWPGKSMSWCVCVRGCVCANFRPQYRYVEGCKWKWGIWVRCVKYIRSLRKLIMIYVSSITRKSCANLLNIIIRWKLRRTLFTHLYWYKITL